MDAEDLWSSASIFRLRFKSNVTRHDINREMTSDVSSLNTLLSVFPHVTKLIHNQVDGGITVCVFMNSMCVGRTSGHHFTSSS